MQRLVPESPVTLVLDSRHKDYAAWLHLQLDTITEIHFLYVCSKCTYCRKQKLFNSTWSVSKYVTENILISASCTAFWEELCCLNTLMADSKFIVSNILYSNQFHFAKILNVESKPVNTHMRQKYNRFHTCFLLQISWV